MKGGKSFTLQMKEAWFKPPSKQALIISKPKRVGDKFVYKIKIIKT